MSCHVKAEAYCWVHSYSLPKHIITIILWIGSTESYAPDASVGELSFCFAFHWHRSTTGPCNLVPFIDGNAPMRAKSPSIASMKNWHVIRPYERLAFSVICRESFKMIVCAHDFGLIFVQLVRLRSVTMNDSLLTRLFYIQKFHEKGL